MNPCPNCSWYRRWFFFIGCPEMDERLSRVDDDIDRQERIRAIGREIDERIERYLRGEG